MNKEQIMKKMSPGGALNLLVAIIDCAMDDAVKCMYAADDFKLHGRKETFKLDNDVELNDFEQCMWHILSIYNFLHNAPYHLQPCVHSWDEFTDVIVKKSRPYVKEQDECKNVSLETCDHLRGYYHGIFNNKTD